jgi:hypothetical protein
MPKPQFFWLILGAWWASLSHAAEGIAPPDTGVSGVYEVVVGARDADPYLKHFGQFGFRETARATLTAPQAKAIYGVNSAVTSIRMQNGAIDSHGLLRILVWAIPLGEGVGYAPPETVGQQMAVLHVADIVRLDDIFRDARERGQQWLPITPVFSDLFGQTKGPPDLFIRRVGVRESGVYGALFNHVFFQRYGYHIAGYGTLNRDAPLVASEFTHHDFIIAGDITASTNYVRDVLGFRAENGDGELNGDWQAGPKQVFGMRDGAAHHYRGFVSPNNICGKLKFFQPIDVMANRSAHQRLGELGITMHTVYSAKLSMIHQLAKQHGLQPSAIQKNEFAEMSFIFRGDDNNAWQVIEKSHTQNVPVRELKLEPTNN